MVELMTSRPKPKSLAAQAKRHLSRGEEALGYFFDGVRKPAAEQIRVVIFAQGRTGSTVLENLLCSTGYFHENGELLNTEYRAEVLCPLHFIRGLANIHPQRHFIFHVKIYHLTEDRKHPVNPARFMRALYAEGWKIIYLKRENKIKHALSNLIAERRQSYFKFDDTTENFKLLINCEEFVAWVRTRFYFEAAEQQILSQFNDFEEIIYERDLENPAVHQRTVDRILVYLSLAPRKASTQNRKVNTLSLRELISNYDEFMDCIYQQNWQKYLPEAQ